MRWARPLPLRPLAPSTAVHPRTAPTCLSDRPDYLGGGTVCHVTSTSHMGRDGLFVVEERQRARGVSGPRMVGASILPHVVSGNTNAATIMINEIRPGRA